MKKLSQKVYMLIAVPLLFEIAFVAALSVTQRNLSLSFEEQTRLRKTTTVLDGILKNLPQSLSETGLYQFSHDERFHKEYLVSVANIREGVTQLRQVEKAGENPLLDRLITSIEDALEKIETTHVSFRSENQFQIMIRLLRYKSILDRVMKTADELAAEQQQKIEVKEKTEQDLRNLIIGLSAAGVTVSIIISIAIAISFHKFMISKIAVLSDNGLRLAAGQPLLPVLSGDDELSRLDGNFHEMASSLAYLRSKEMALIDNAVEIICSLDNRGRFEQVNNAALGVLQYSADELNGRPISAIAATGQDVINERLKLIASGVSSEPFQISLKRKDSSIRDFMWSMTFSREKKTFFCVAHDVTERNRADQFKRDMIAMVSHDLRSPLTSLQVSFNLFAGGTLGSLNEKGNHKVQQGLGIIRRLVSKINALLDIEQLESGNLRLSIEKHSMESLIGKAIDSIQSLAESKKVNIIFDQQQSHEYSCDAERITDVLINYLHNAVKFSPKGGTIVVSVKPLGDMVEVAVADGGKGVPLDEQETIFEKFRQSASDAKEVQAQGSGLGLAIAKAVIAAHHGSLGVRTNQPVGSVFWFRIPASVG
jgi:PAS domain S-box-containing protein